MSKTEDQVIETMRSHEVSYGAVVDDDGTEGSIDCSCGWGKALWSVQGRCECFDDADDDFDSLECRCGYEQRVDRVAKDYQDRAEELGTAHQARGVAPILGADTQVVANVLRAHNIDIVDERDETGQTRSVTCPCGYRKTLWHVDGTCTCTTASIELGEDCPFDRRILHAIQDSRAKDADPGHAHQVDHLVALTGT